jgi:XTP/dITP diphosphohydrolase
VPGGPQPELERLVGVMHALRSGCPWDAEQTHLSLVHYLVEETCEVVDAVESGDDADLLEELGDLLLQVLFHSEIAAEEGRFTVEDVARRIADKLIARHPYVFTDAPVPDDLVASWERRKAVEKGRSSTLDGIPHRLSALARAHKVILRATSHGLDHASLGLPDAATLPTGEAGDAVLRLVASMTAAGLDPEQEVRAALRVLEARVAEAESAPA